MNKLSAYFTTKIAAMAATIGAVVGIVAGWSTLIDAQPFFALKQTVIENERRAAFNRINDLNFQVEYLQMWDDPTSQDMLRRKLEERDFLECAFQYRICQR